MTLFNKFFLFSFFIIAQATAYGETLVEVCSPEKAEELLRYEQEGAVLIDYWLREFEQKYGVNVKQIQSDIKSGDFNAQNQLELATSILMCTQAKLKKGLVYLCADNMPNTAWTLPVISRRVFINESTFWKTSIDYKKSVVIHEATHKCGTNDATYYPKGTSPHNVGIVGWSTIADTYSYWSYYRLCIPGIDCD